MNKSKDKLVQEIRKIVGEGCVEDWTADAAEDDYFMATTDELDNVKKIRNLIKKNIVVALASKNEYIKAMAEQIRDNPKGFQSGEATFNHLFPGLKTK